MTLEEKALQVAENLPPDCARDFNERAGAMIAEAMREAEDHALEAAARLVESSVAHDHRGVVAAIRSLKSRVAKEEER